MGEQRGEPMLLCRPAWGGCRLDLKPHAGFFWRVATLFEVAWGASRGDIFPVRSPALPPRNDMIEGQIVGDAAILAGKFIAKEKIESCEGRVFGWLHILLQRDDRRNLHGPAWAVDFRSEEHTSELQSLMRISYAVFCLKKKKHKQEIISNSRH